MRVLSKGCNPAVPARARLNQTGTIHKIPDKISTSYKIEEIMNLVSTCAGSFIIDDLTLRDYRLLKLNVLHCNGLQLF